jgi:uncharacterized protein involved in copper resistance
MRPTEADLREETEAEATEVTLLERAEAAENIEVEVPTEANSEADLSEAEAEESIEDEVLEADTITIEMRSHSTSLMTRRSAMDQNHSPRVNSSSLMRELQRIRKN